MSHKEDLHDLQKKLFKHLKNQGYFITSTMLKNVFEAGTMKKEIVQGKMFTNVWVYIPQSENKNIITYNGHMGYYKKDSRDFYESTTNQKYLFNEVTEKKFELMLNSFDNEANGNKDFVAFNNFGYMNKDFYIEEMKKSEKIRKLLIGKEKSGNLTIEKINTEYWLYDLSKVDSMIRTMPTILEYLRKNNKDDWLTLIKNGLHNSNPSRNDYTKTINYLKEYISRDDLLEIIINDLFYKRTTGKNKFLRKEIESLISEDSPYFARIAKKFTFLNESKKNNNEEVSSLLGDDFAKNIEEKVIYKKIDMSKLNKSVGVIGWNINTYEKAFNHICNSFKDYYEIKSVITLPISRSQKVQEITIIHNDDKLNNDIFVKVCNGFVKNLLKNKNEENYLDYKNLDKKDLFAQNIKTITHKLILENVIEHNNENTIKVKKNKL